MTITWNKPTAKEFQDSYVDRLIEENPSESLDEIDYLARKGEEVSLHFGSGWYGYSPRNHLGGQTESIFLNGYCVLFAHCSNERLGLNKYLLLTLKGNKDTDWLGHILSSVDEDSFFDIEGVHTSVQLHNKYPLDKYDYKVVSEDYLWDSNILHRDSYEHPSLWLDEFERNYTSFVVEESINTHCKALEGDLQPV